MGQIRVEKNMGGIEGLCLIEPAVFRDARGYFVETWNEKDMLDAGLPYNFVQDNESKSSRGVLRGLHYQIAHPQAKLVRVIAGEVYDVAVDIRKDSDTFGRYFGCVLSEKNKKQLLIPKGFAHGFLVLSDVAIFSYKCDDYYHPDDESGIIWNDPEIGINWPLGSMKLNLTERDKKWTGLKTAVFPILSNCHQDRLVKN